MREWAYKNKPRSLGVVCLLGLLVLGASMAFCYRTFGSYKQYLASAQTWLVIMMGIHVIMLSGIAMMYWDKRGLWVFLLGAVAFFMVPKLGGTIDAVMGLLTPVYFILFAMLFILLGKQYKKLSGH